MVVRWQSVGGGILVVRLGPDYHNHVRKDALMKMDVVANSGNDEFYTPAYAIEPLVKYIPPVRTIWCPFDTEESLIVRRFRQSGFVVMATHIKDGLDFFETETFDVRLVPIHLRPNPSVEASALSVQAQRQTIGRLEVLNGHRQIPISVTVDVTNLHNRGDLP